MWDPWRRNPSVLVHIFVIVLAGTSTISTMGAALEPSPGGWWRQRAADQVPPPTLDSVATEFSGTSALADTWDKLASVRSPRDASSSSSLASLSSRTLDGAGSGNHIVSNSSKLTSRSLRRVFPLLLQGVGEGRRPF